MKIEKMTAKQFAEYQPQAIGELIHTYCNEIKTVYQHPIHLERMYTKRELQQIAAALGTAARTIITINRTK